MMWTGEIRLRGVIEADLLTFFEHQCEPDANRMAAFPSRTMDHFMAHWAKILGDQTVTVRTILFDRRVAGNIVCWEADGKRLVGYWLGKEFWGRGVATYALSNFVSVIKDRPIFAHVAKQNIPSIRVLEKCGFQNCTNQTPLDGVTNDGIEELIFALGTNEDR